MKLTKPEIFAAFEEAGIKLKDNQAKQFVDYAESLLTWNVKANLISKNDEERILDRHFIESGALSLFEEFQDEKEIMDLGTGGGFPGVPLKILCPWLKVSLLDSKQKKCMFLRELVGKLEIEMEVFWGRAEEIKMPRKFDIIVSRAVSRLAQLYSWTFPLLKPKGYLIAIKGSRVMGEIEEFKTKHKSVFVSLKDFPVITESSDMLKVVFVQKRN